MSSQVGALGRVDVNALHRCEIDHQTAIDRSSSTDVVTAAARARAVLRRRRHRSVGGAGR
ncbi:MAG TPA: hypothetical protein VL882_12090 [Vicinamibacterales bacterium]|nr:hypothetical protein [Vicinamibacterales bacterium]